MRNFSTTIASTAIAMFALLCLQGPAGAAPPEDVQRLTTSLQPFVDCLAGKQQTFALDVQIEAGPVERREHVTIQIARDADDQFDFAARHKDYQVFLQRRTDQTAMILPLHEVAFVGTGDVEGPDTLVPAGLLPRLNSPDSKIGMYLPLLTGGDAQLLALMLTSLANPKFDEASNTWTHKEKYSLRFDDENSTLEFHSPDVRVRLALSLEQIEINNAVAVDGLQVTQLDRTALERQLARGIRRAGEILAPGPTLTSPQQEDRAVPHGRLKWIDGQRLVLLEGTPDEIGTAHGQLLQAEALRCIDSVLYTFGTFQTIRSGRWFQHDLAAAYERLAPHIPEDHTTENAALGTALELEPRVTQTLNVFPELFHCSGFAVFGRATRDGTLYHGRVLDYMTTIGLQDAATTFIVHVDGRIPFANVGYAGFIGSVSGMNARGISLGEMGGKGEGQWDGAPMATLMRRALEESHTLEDVMRLWEASPRTCEYYYVFADGKTNRAVGVAATPETIEWILPGQSHPKLGPGIPDAVVLSAGSRLATLRERVQSRYGQIDAELGMWLMSRPVAMKSNLHNVLFVPADRVFYVANASHDKPAAERPYAKLNLIELLQSMKRRPAKETAAR
mgnify:CR=1 FL=1